VSYLTKILSSSSLYRRLYAINFTIIPSRDAITKRMRSGSHPAPISFSREELMDIQLSLISKRVEAKQDVAHSSTRKAPR